MPELYSPYWLKARAPWNPAPAEFSDMVIDAYLHRTGAVALPVFDAGTFSMRTADGSLVFLEPYYRAYCDSEGDARDSILERSVDALQPLILPTSKAHALTRMMPRLWSRDAEDRQRRDLEHLGIPTSLISTRPWHGMLLQSLAIDGEHTMTPVTEAMLRSWDLTFDTAWPHAVSNLASKTPSMDPIEESPGLFHLGFQDGYNAARVFVPEMLSISSEGIVAVAPVRDELWWCRKDDIPALKRLCETAMEALESDLRALAPVLLTAPASGWKTFHVPSRHPAYAEAQSMSLHWLAAAYDRQRTRLIEMFERVGQEEPWVAKLVIFKNRKAKNSVSCATLTKGVVTLLPRSDWLSFANPDTGGSPVITTWDSGVKALGGEQALQPFDAYPPRYLVSTFPNEAALSKVAQV